MNRLPVLLSAVALVTVVLVPTVTQAAPANDDFANAASIGSLPASETADLSTATMEAGEPWICDPEDDIANSVWYSFTPSSTVRVNADTFGSGFDTAINVFTGSSLGSLDRVVCNDDADEERDELLETEVESTSLVGFLAHSGTTYYIQVAGADGETGTAQLHVEDVGLVEERRYIGDTAGTIAWCSEPGIGGTCDVFVAEASSIDVAISDHTQPGPVVGHLLFFNATDSQTDESAVICGSVAGVDVPDEAASVSVWTGSLWRIGIDLFSAEVPPLCALAHTPATTGDITVTVTP